MFSKGNPEMRLLYNPELELNRTGPAACADVYLTKARGHTCWRRSRDEHAVGLVGRLARAWLREKVWVGLGAEGPGLQVLRREAKAGTRSHHRCPRRRDDASSVWRQRAQPARVEHSTKDAQSATTNPQAISAPDAALPREKQ